MEAPYQVQDIDMSEATVEFSMYTRSIRAQPMPKSCVIDTILQVQQTYVTVLDKLTGNGSSIY